MTIRLHYIGDGAWLPGVPAADHEVATEAEADRLVYRYAGDERLLDDEGKPVPTGLYEVAAAARAAKPTKPAGDADAPPAPPEEA